GAGGARAEGVGEGRGWRGGGTEFASGGELGAVVQPLSGGFSPSRGETGPPGAGGGAPGAGAGRAVGGGAAGGWACAGWACAGWACAGWACAGWACAGWAVAALTPNASDAPREPRGQRRNLRGVCDRRAFIGRAPDRAPILHRPARDLGAIFAWARNSAGVAHPLGDAVQGRAEGLIEQLRLRSPLGQVALAPQQAHLEQVERIDVGVAELHGLREEAMLRREAPLLPDREDGRRRALVLGAQVGEDLLVVAELREVELRD